MRKISQLFQRKKRKNTPSLPLSTLNEALYRAEIGSLAYRIGYYLQKENHVSDEAFFASVYGTETATSAEADELLAYARLVYGWIEAGENVNEMLKNNPCHFSIEEGLFHTFKEYKSELHKRKTMIGKWETNRYPKTMQKGTEWKVYRDVMNAATQRKFLLITEDEVDDFLYKGKIVFQGKVKERKDIPLCRELAKKSLEDESFSSLHLNSLLLVISEAATNVIKHAIEGEVTVMEYGANLHIIVKDKGPGFILEDLPNTILMAGYSTKKSLGQGFTLMLKIVDKIQLALTADGSILVLSVLNKKEN